MAVRREHGEGVASDAVRGTYGLEDPARALALAAGLVLTGTYVSVLHHVNTVVGGRYTLLVEVALALVTATVVARALRPRTAAAVGAGLLVLGYAFYMQVVPSGWLLLSNLGKAMADAFALLSGLPILRMTRAGVWALGVAPGPVFLSWYLLVRQRYAAGTAVGGAMLSVFVLTGDASPAVTLTGVGAAAAVVGFGELERRLGTVEQLDTLVALLAVMVLVGASMPVGGAQSVLPERQAPTVESGVARAGDQVQVGGSLRLNPEVRFVVQSSVPAYWRVGAYDRYTASGWVRSGRAQTLEAGLAGPTRGGLRIEQRFTARTGVGVMPAAWRPTRVFGGAADRAQVSSLGDLQAAGTLSAGESYRVTSIRPLAGPERLRNAGTDYPDDIERQYTQLPGSTPDRVGEFTEEVTADAATPYEKAVDIERWLEANKDYSLEVDQANGQVADQFLFEMDAGYCVYFATAMVVMLRSEGIPARFVVGYSTGQRVGEHTWVVRAMDAHAWVEVYFPGVGWVRFDPTPAGEREDREQDRLEEAREDGAEGVDAAGSENGTWTPTANRGGSDTSTSDSTDGESGETGGAAVGSDAQTVPQVSIRRYQSGAVAGEPASAFPARSVLGLGAVLAMGLAAAVRRNERVASAYRLARVQWQRDRGSPEADVERAFERLETVMERRYRPRRRGETRAAYLSALADRGLDERVLAVGDCYHRARYDDGVTRADAAAAVGLADALVREWTPLVRSLR